MSADDAGIIPNGIRDRALRAVLERGPISEDPERTRLAREYWRHFRSKQARGEEAGAGPLGRPPAVEFVIKKTKLPTPHLWVVATEIAQAHRLQPYQTFTVDDSTGQRSAGPPP